MMNPKTLFFVTTRFIVDFRRTRDRYENLARTTYALETVTIYRRVSSNLGKVKTRAAVIVSLL